ncbi:hypothetical protein B0J11DRAFT_579105 [Dendryphion nanum]|uniref:Uncharacterized protein n=1 Tax=Dendryphion nanum TaxID=256645 RepID=A0A9P9DX33_9PLEO|nr:hypothetical protein B0J11DRAFT_579105 [Dendryphion nanum]
MRRENPDLKVTKRINHERKDTDGVNKAASHCRQTSSSTRQNQAPENRVEDMTLTGPQPHIFAIADELKGLIMERLGSNALAAMAQVHSHLSPEIYRVLWKKPHMNTRLYPDSLVTIDCVATHSTWLQTSQITFHVEDLEKAQDNLTVILKTIPLNPLQRIIFSSNSMISETNKSALQKLVDGSRNSIQALVFPRSTRRSRWHPFGHETGDECIWTRPPYATHWEVEMTTREGIGKRLDTIFMDATSHNIHGCMSLHRIKVDSVVGFHIWGYRQPTEEPQDILPPMPGLNSHGHIFPNLKSIYLCGVNLQAANPAKFSNVVKLANVRRLHITDCRGVESFFTHTAPLFTRMNSFIFLDYLQDLQDDSSLFDFVRHSQGFEELSWHVDQTMIEPPCERDDGFLSDVLKRHGSSLNKLAINDLWSAQNRVARIFELFLLCPNLTHLSVHYVHLVTRRMFVEGDYKDEWFNDDGVAEDIVSNEDYLAQDTPAIVEYAQNEQMASNNNSDLPERPSWEDCTAVARSYSDSDEHSNNTAYGSDVDDQNTSEPHPSSDGSLETTKVNNDEQPGEPSENQDNEAGEGEVQFLTPFQDLLYHDAEVLQHLKCLTHFNMEYELHRDLELRHLSGKEDDALWQKLAESVIECFFMKGFKLQELSFSPRNLFGYKRNSPIAETRIFKVAETKEGLPIVKRDWTGKDWTLFGNSRWVSQQCQRVIGNYEDNIPFPDEWTRE